MFMPLPPVITHRPPSSSAAPPPPPSCTANCNNNNNNNNNNGGGGGGGMSTAGIIAIVVAVASVVLCLVIWIWWCRYRHKKGKSAKLSMFTGRKSQRSPKKKGVWRSIFAFVRALRGTKKGASQLTGKDLARLKQLQEQKEAQRHKEKEMKEMQASQRAKLQQRAKEEALFAPSQRELSRKPTSGSLSKGQSSWPQERKPPPMPPSLQVLEPAVPLNRYGSLNQAMQTRPVQPASYMYGQPPLNGGRYQSAGPGDLGGGGYNSYDMGPQYRPSSSQYTGRQMPPGYPYGPAGYWTGRLP